MHRFFYEKLSSVSEKESVSLSGGEAAHLFKILRARPGEIVGLLDGNGRVAEAEVIQDKKLEIKTVRTVPIPEKRIHLFLTPPRRQKMDQALRQLTELGAWSITPVICERSVVQLDGPSAPERWMELLRESCKQSGNPFLPQLFAPVSMTDAVRAAAERCRTVFYGDPRENPGDAVPLTGDIGLFIGPEGGFSPAELELLGQSSFHPLRIGNWILRVETAAAAGLAVLTVRETL